MFVDSAQTRPGIPSGPGATSREAILFDASSTHSTVQVVDGRASLTSSWVYTCGQWGGGGGAQLLRHYPVRPPSRIGFERLNKVPPGLSFRDLDFPL